jgi:hypothetical protein
MGVDSRLALNFFPGWVGSHVFEFRGRFALKDAGKVFVYWQLGLMDEGNEWQNHL